MSDWLQSKSIKTQKCWAFFTCDQLKGEFKAFKEQKKAQLCRYYENKKKDAESVAAKVYKKVLMFLMLQRKETFYLSEEALDAELKKCVLALRGQAMEKKKEAVQ